MVGLEPATWDTELLRSKIRKKSWDIGRVCDKEHWGAMKEKKNWEVHNTLWCRSNSKWKVEKEKEDTGRSRKEAEQGWAGGQSQVRSLEQLNLFPRRSSAVCYMQEFSRNAWSSLPLLCFSSVPSNCLAFQRMNEGNAEEVFKLPPGNYVLNDQLPHWNYLPPLFARATSLPSLLTTPNTNTYFHLPCGCCPQVCGRQGKGKPLNGTATGWRA
jgi:hypothetical protein